MTEEEILGADPICFECDKPITDKEFSSMQVSTQRQDCFYVFHTQCFFERMDKYLTSQEIRPVMARMAN